MRLNVDSKDNLSSLLAIDDIYDTLESEETAQEFIAKLDDDQKKELVKNLFDFLQAESNQINLEEPPTPSIAPQLDSEIPEVPKSDDQLE